MVRDIFMLTYYLGGINLRDLLAYDFKNKNDMRYVRHKTSNSKKGENEIVFTLDVYKRQHHSSVSELFPMSQQGYS